MRRSRSAREGAGPSTDNDDELMMLQSNETGIQHLTVHHGVHAEKFNRPHESVPHFSIAGASCHPFNGVMRYPYAWNGRRIAGYTVPFLVAAASMQRLDLGGDLFFLVRDVHQLMEALRGMQWR